MEQEYIDRREILGTSGLMIALGEPLVPPARFFNRHIINNIDTVKKFLIWYRNEKEDIREALKDSTELQKAGYHLGKLIGYGSWVFGGWLAWKFLNLYIK